MKYNGWDLEGTCELIRLIVGSYLLHNHSAYTLYCYIITSSIASTSLVVKCGVCVRPPPPPPEPYRSTSTSPELRRLRWGNWSGTLSPTDPLGSLAIHSLGFASHTVSSDEMDDSFRPSVFLSLIRCHNLRTRMMTSQATSRDLERSIRFFWVLVPALLIMARILGAFATRWNS